MSSIVHPPSSLSRPLVGNLRSFSHLPSVRVLFEKAVICRITNAKSLSSWIEWEKSQTQLFRVAKEDPVVGREQEDGPQTFPIWKIIVELGGNWKKMTVKRRKIVLGFVGGEDCIPNEVLMVSNDAKTFYLSSILQRFCSAFFLGLDFQWCLDFEIDTDSFPNNRIQSVTGKPQYFIADIFDQLETRLDRNLLAVIGVSWEDLYPDKDAQFALGQASYQRRVAAVSFGRFDPKDCANDSVDNKIDNGRDIHRLTGRVLWRLLRCLSHEICHVFYFAHCSFFECAMSNSMSVADAESKPIFLCPICLRKLQKVCRFDVLNRYKELEQLFRFIVSIVDDSEGYFENSISWLEKVIQFLKNAENVSLESSSSCFG